MLKLFLTLDIIIKRFPLEYIANLGWSQKAFYVVFLGRLSPLRVCSHYLISRLLRTFWCPRRASPPSSPPPRFQDDKCCNAARAFFYNESQCPSSITKIGSWTKVSPTPKSENLAKQRVRRVLSRGSLDFNSGRIFNEKNVLHHPSLLNSRCLIPCYK